ncbi:hypothetical protein GCM10017786_43160 [Amycolatopsis deserti]|uniref:1-phosphofructokinase n=1 Tax=Amycolatopsis deserti TaxID=185696 RepID=A0ABQ3J508_9PSEU|nr:hypothetical protein [Amycolatopsis deserti]GHF05064.1 hypothetical protein GCM10017786_43160 [Amycolatopsis deserti]
MIVTVTPNPSLDHTVELNSLRRGEVLRAGPSHRLARCAVQPTVAGPADKRRPVVPRVVSA